MNTKKKRKLSKRELVVLELLKLGMKNREIAKEIEVNEKTVSTYILRVRKKLNVDKKYNVYYLVSKALELELIN